MKNGLLNGASIAALLAFAVIVAPTPSDARDALQEAQIIFAQSGEAGNKEEELLLQRKSRKKTQAQGENAGEEAAGKPEDKAAARAKNAEKKENDGRKANAAAAKKARDAEERAAARAKNAEEKAAAAGEAEAAATKKAKDAEAKAAARANNAERKAAAAREAEAATAAARRAERQKAAKQEELKQAAEKNEVRRKREEQKVTGPNDGVAKKPSTIANGKENAIGTVERADEQKRVRDEAKRPARISEKAKRPKRVDTADKTINEVVKQRGKQPVVVVRDQITASQRQELREAERRRRERSREDRGNEIGAALVGAVIGTVIPQLGGRVEADEGDRIVYRRDGRLFVRSDDSALLRGGDTDTSYRRLDGGIVEETITRRNGSKIITLRDAAGNVLRRVKVTRSGERIVLFASREADWGRPYRPVQLPTYEIGIPREEYIVSARRADRDLFYRTFDAEPVYDAPQRYSLRDVRENEQVRSLVRRVDLDTITFESGSAFVTESQVGLLGDIAGGIADMLGKDPSAVFLIEGHTDAVGPEIANIALSDRRAESVARILTEAYDIPPENMVTQGYGEQYLKVETEYDERANRRVTVRNITPILQSSN